MTKKQTNIKSYDLQNVILYGSAGSGGLIFFVLFFVFLGSQVSSDHPPLSTDTIGEMMGWATFFFFTFSSYFTAAVFVWKLKDFFAQHIVSWIPISFLGSILFSLSFFSWVWAFSVPSADGTAPAPFFYVLLFALLCGLVLTIVTGTSSAIVSAFVNLETSRDEISLK